MSLPRQIRLRAPAPLSAVVRPPGSKSLSNRALVLAGMASGRSLLRGMLEAEDTQVMGECLRRLGVGLEIDGEVWTVEGRGAELGARETGEPPLFVGTAGTAARFLTAALAAAAGAGRPAHVLDGTPRMRERPMATLIHALREQGARIVALEGEDALPFRIEPQAEALRGGEIVLARPTSSQFVSALVIAATRATRPTRLVLREGTPARPYVDMTLAVLEAFGGRAGWEDENVLCVEPSPLSARDYAIEPDASAASYVLALAAIHGGTATIPDLGRNSLQGDAHFHAVLERMGARAEQSASETRVTGAGLDGIDLDLSDMPDMTLTTAVVALFAAGPTTIRGVAILRHHESDRLAAGATELRKLGADVDEREDGLHIVPPANGPRPGVTIQTYDDHRMAMAFAMVGDVVIDEPACVGKTFPRYFEELAGLGMTGDG